MRLIALIGCLAGLVLGAVALGMGTNGSQAPVARSMSGEVIVYGEAPSTFGRLWVPADPATDPAPMVVVIHGGFWRRAFGLETTDALSERLADEGFAVWNIEYGRTGERLGGWPYTFDHVAAAVEYVGELAVVHPIDPGRVAVVGHSAGGHLALWVAGQDLDGVDVGLAVGLGAIADIDLAAADGIGNNAVEVLLGDTVDTVPERLDAIRPAPRIPVVLVNGGLDDVVRSRYSQPRGFDADVHLIEGADHFDLIEPDGETAEVLVEVLIEAFDGA